MENTQKKYNYFALADDDFYSALDKLEAIRKEAFFSDNERLREHIEEVQNILDVLSCQLEESDKGGLSWV